jgi:hypothetical protein
MNLPFSTDQYLGVFEEYNRAVWPVQVSAYVLAAAALLLIFWRIRPSDRIISGILAFFWIFMGGVYHLGFFSKINNAAYLFGAAFVIQAGLFIFSGIHRDNLSFGFKPGVYSITGMLFILYAAVVYPLIGHALGHGWPNSPSFGIAPCPGSIFTLGMLLLTTRRVPKHLLVIPALWSLVGFAAALSLGIKEDVGLLIAGIGGTALLIVRDHRRIGSAKEKAWI